MAAPKLFVAVIGASKASKAEVKCAEQVGRELASRGAVLVCGGLGGVMEAACRGASKAGGLTVGILPGDSRQTANPWVQIPIVTTLGYVRNVAVVRSAQAIIAIGGAYGTLSEIAFALQAGLPVVGLDTWSMSRDGQVDTGVKLVASPLDAVNLALELIGE